MVHQRTPLVALGCAAALTLSVLPLAATADARTDSVAAAAQWIANNTTAGSPDALIALAAADTQPAKLAELAALLPAPDTTSAATNAKRMIAADAANLDARFYGDQACGANWATTLRAEADADKLSAYWAPQLVAIALARLGEPVPANAFDRILDAQGENGSWGYGTGDGFTPQPDDTAMSIYALNLIAESPVESDETRAAAAAAMERGIAWTERDDVRKLQDGNYFWATYSPANSTGLVASALAEAGEDVTSPQAFMIEQQALTGTGAWSNTLNGTRSNAMATMQGILAVAGAGYGSADATGDPVRTCAQPPSITAQPSDGAAQVGGTATLTATVASADSFRWQRFAEGAWVDVDGATSATLAVAVSDATVGQYRLTATNASGSTFTHVASVSVAEPTPTPTPTPTVKPSATPTATVKPSATPTATVKPTQPGTVDVYTTPGVHNVNGRRWSTTCEKYSKTTRCQTSIWATTVRVENGRYVQGNGWAFNNQTYLPSPRSLWKDNPLGNKGTWTSAEGRRWKTECDTPATGRNGCRNFIWGTTISAERQGDGTWKFVRRNGWLFNGMVRFS